MMIQKAHWRYSRGVRICALPFAALFAVSAAAANISWTGATDAVWSTGGDWVGGVAPATADVAVFDVGSVTNLNTTLGADRTILGLRITTPSGLITIGGANTLTLGAGGIDMSAASQNLLLNALVALAADQSWNVAALRTLTANGVISGTNVNLNKIGLGDLTLAGANTFTGTTTIGGGTLNVNGSLNGTTGTGLTFAGTGIFNVAEAAGVSQGMGVVKFNGGDGVVKSTHAGSGTGTVRFSSRGGRATGATGNFVLSGGTAGTPGTPGTNNIAITGELTGQLLDIGLFYNGSSYAAYDAGGFVRGLIYGTDANALASIPAGATIGVVDATKNVQISGNITAQTTASVNTIQDPGAFSITLSGGQTLSFNSILKSGGSAATISSGTGITTASGSEMVIRTDVAADSLTISTPILINGTNSLTKSGAGTLILSAANTYGGATGINAGILQIGSGGTAGSLGAGSVSNSGSLVFNRSDDVTVPNVISGIGALTKNGAGTLKLAGANSYTGTNTLSAGTLAALGSTAIGTGAVFVSGGNLTLQSDGSGSGLGNGKVESINFGNNVTVTANTAFSVDRITLSGNGIFFNAQNKTLQLGTLGIGAQTLTVNNSNGFGLEFTGTTTMSGAPNFAVNGGNNTPVVQGLTLSGKVTGAFGFTKSSGGTLVLANATNDFGSASTISVTGGLLSVRTDGALGAANNIISLNNGGLQADGTFTTARRINKVGASTFDVTQGNIAGSLNVLTLTTAFNNGAASANALTKNGNGILEINASNASYTGAITINAGAIRVSNAGALGAAANNTTVASFNDNNTGGAVQLNAVSLAELFNISSTGINSGGAIENFAGTSELNGLITLANNAMIGSTSGTLNIKGGIAATTKKLSFSGAGNITISNTAITGTTSTLTKIGSGTVEIQNADPLTGNITVNAGTLKLSVAGTTVGNLTITPSGVLILDNSGTDTANRLSGKTLGLSGATVNFVGSALAEAVGILTVNAGLTTINLSGAGGTLSFDSLASRAAGGAVSINSSGASSVQFATTAPALVPAAVGIIPGFFFGNDFATHGGAATPITAYTSYITGDLATVVTNETVKPTGAQSSVNSMLINALNLTAGVGVTINPGQTLTLDAGELINNGGGSITGGVLTTSGNTELIANYATDGSIDSNISGTSGGFTKIGAGNLTFGRQMTYSGQTTINQGKLTLGVSQGLLVNNPLVVNVGATLDLGTGSQYVGRLSSTGTVENSGGIITGTGGTLTVNQTSTGTFAGSIQGSINLVKTGDRTLTLTSANTTTGSVAIIGGIGSLRERNEVANDLGRGLTLRDGGSLLNVSSITVRGATLNLDNSGFVQDNTAAKLAAAPLVTKDMANRINDAAPITLDNGTIRYVGRLQTNSTETLGPVTVSGFSSFTMLSGGNPQGSSGVNSATLTLSSLTRMPGSGIQFNRAKGTNTSEGQIGNFPRVVIANDDTSGLSFSNGTVVGMVSYNDNDKYFPVSYVPGLGFGSMGQSGFPNNYMAGADGNGFSGANTLANAQPTNDFNTGASQLVRAGGQTVNSVGIQGSGFAPAPSTVPLTFQAPNDTLTIGSGWLAMWFQQTQIGTAAVRGAITSGQSELFLFGGYITNWGDTGNLNTIHSVIKDNGASSVKFVMNLARNTYLTANNTYTGGTNVNGELATDNGDPYRNFLFLNGDAGSVVIPNATNPAEGLVINGANVTMVTNEGQIGSNNIVTLSGGSTLALVGNNTFAGLVFNSNAGSVTPTITPNGTLKITGDITSTPTNAIVTPRINGGNLDLNGNSFHTITVGAMPQGDYVNNSSGVLTPQVGLDISSVIQNGGFTKEGAGILRISGANTYDRDTIINAGTLLLGSANVIPDGAGKGNVTLNGTLNLNGFTETINGLSGAASGVVDNLSGGGTYTLTIGGNNAGGSYAGAIKNTAGTVTLTKVGSGTQILSGSNSYAGQTAVTPMAVMPANG